jgi:hypothetical protein
MTRIAALLTLALLTQGCAAIPVAVAVGAMGVLPGDADPAAESYAETTVTSAAAAVAPTGLPRLGPMPAQTLSPGECALFLFTRTEPSQFVAFAQADGESLLLNLGGVATALSGVAPIGALDDAFEQTYRGENLDARLTATLAESLPQGRRAPQAVLRLVAPDGAAQVTPLAGLVACEAAAS